MRHHPTYSSLELADRIQVPGDNDDSFAARRDLFRTSRQPTQYRQHTVDAVKKLLFLDFDGVLHPYFGREQNYFCRLDFLIEALGSNTKRLEIIISSSWRFHYPLDEILGYFPESMQKLIAGATPEVEPGRHQRYREICAYLSQYKRTRDWRALDDDILGFPKNCTQLIACDHRVGVDEIGVKRLQLWLEGMDWPD